MKIAIDPGHGGRDPGCVAGGWKEKDLTLDLARRLGHLLRERKIQTLLIRENDRAVPIRERARIALAGDCALLISLHADWSPSPQAHGLTAYVVAKDARSERIARRLLEFARREEGRLLEDNGVLPDTRTRVGRLGVLRGTFRRMPAVLVECGFLSNPRDAGLLRDPRFRQALCLGLAEGLRSWSQGPE